MKNQSTINKRQRSVNKRQTSINNDQNNINDYQIGKNDDQGVINDKTKFELRFNNLYAIIIAVFVVAASWFNLSGRVDRLTDRVNALIVSQEQLTAEFRSWRSQAETRLGTVESRQNTVISYVNQYLNTNIK